VTATTFEAILPQSHIQYFRYLDITKCVKPDACHFTASCYVAITFYVSEIIKGKLCDINKLYKN